MEKINLRDCQWLNEPQYYILNEHRLIIATEPHSGLWSRTYTKDVLGNAPILYVPSDEDGTFTVRCEFQFKKRFDECGLVVYITDDCWFKICAQYKDEGVSRISTVITMNGYSDISSMNISSDIHSMYFRLHHRGFDFKVENSFNGIHYKQMRIFHLDPLGQRLKVGMFACSPLESSFDATFTEFTYETCQWEEFREEL